MWKSGCLDGSLKQKVCVVVTLVIAPWQMGSGQLVFLWVAHASLTHLCYQWVRISMAQFCFPQQGFSVELWNTVSERKLCLFSWSRIHWVEVKVPLCCGLTLHRNTLVLGWVSYWRAVQSLLWKTRAAGLQRDIVQTSYHKSGSWNQMLKHGRNEKNHCI